MEEKVITSGSDVFAGAWITSSQALFNSSVEITELTSVMSDVFPLISTVSTGI